MDDRIPDPSTASVRRRIAAHVVDAVVLAVGGTLLMVLVASVFGPSVSARVVSEGDVVLVLDSGGFLARSTILTAASAAYFTLSWAGGWQATPGQRVLGISVVAVGGRGALGLARAGRRWLALGAPMGVIAAATIESVVLWGLATMISLVWALTLLVSTWRSPSSRGLHDHIAGSVVLR